MGNTKNHSRASDFGELLMSGSTGFTVRKRTGIGLFFHVFMLVSMVILGAALLIYYQSPQGCFLAIAIGLSLALIAQNLEKLKKVKQSLEFMNALFSSALGRGYDFCCVIKATGEIVFYNRPFQSVFPAYTVQDRRSVDVLFELYNLPLNDREKIKTLIVGGLDGSVVTTLHEGENDARSITFTVEPIDRPTGFALVRGK